MIKERAFFKCNNEGRKKKKKAKQTITTTFQLPFVRNGEIFVFQQKRNEILASNLIT